MDVGLKAGRAGGSGGGGVPSCVHGALRAGGFDLAAVGMALVWLSTVRVHLQAAVWMGCYVSVWEM